MAKQLITFNTPKEKNW